MTKEKSQAEIQIDALAEVFGIATTGFEEYYKSCEKNSKGTNSQSASSGYNSQSVSSGNYSQSASSGYNSGCTSVGYRAKADLVDGKKIKPNCWYIVNNGKWVEVDFTDGVFTYVISTKNGVKKVKTESGKILFIVSDDKGNSAHGETIAKAREDLIYKVVAKFDGELPKKATGTEWIGIYRAVTGACGAGVRNFVETTGKSLDEIYIAEEIAKLVNGKYGAEKFAEKIKANG